MNVLAGCILGVILATAGFTWAQWQPPGEALDLSLGSLQGQLFWDQQALDEPRREMPLYDPCPR